MVSSELALSLIPLWFVLPSRLLRAQPAIYTCPVMLLEEKKLVQLYLQWLWIGGVHVFAAFSSLTEVAQVLATLSFIVYLCFASGINQPQQAFAARYTTKHQTLSVSTALSFATVQ